MAKVGARSIGFLTIFLIIYNLNICATNPQSENDKKTQYESVPNTPSPTIATASAQQNATPSASATPVVVPYSNRPLLGVNGTGQRKDMSELMATATSTTLQPDTIKASDDVKKTQNQFPKKVLGATANGSTTLTKTGATVSATAAVGGATVAAAAGVAVKPKQEETEEEKIIDTIDVPENETLDALKNQNLTVNLTEDHHHYYNSTIVVDKEKADAIWNDIKTITPNVMLSQSHRRAMTVVLSFDFPFYGHPVRNVTVATGGFIYTGDYVHSWLAATQYIAPLMANFDTSLSNASFVRLNDTGSSFTVIWENVSLQDKQEVGNFTFSATLHKNGDIVFTYFQVPIFVNAIQDDKHPVKVGLSDAYIIDKVVYFARRKTIYEYHRVNFANAEITNSTIITLKALPTCLEYTDCASCVNHVTAFNCTWCPALNKCSTGTDRKKQEWLASGCDRNFITEENFCPAIGQKGNNANKQNDNTSTTTTTVDGLETSSTETPIEKSNSDFHTGTQMKSMVDVAAERKSMGVTLGVFIPICLVSCALLWILYAYRNPHTRSGQLLIQGIMSSNNYTTLFNKENEYTLSPISPHPSRDNLQYGNPVFSYENNIIPNSNNKQLTDIMCLLKNIGEDVKILNSKTDRITLELISIRSEITTIKSKIYGDVCHIKQFLPQEPLKTMSEYDTMEDSLKNEETFKNVVKELCLCNEKSCDKFVRNGWKSLFSDSLAEQFSWRGTNTKKCIRGTRITLALRCSFKQKFSINDDEFDKLSQKHFQYAHDRLSKSKKYQEKKQKLNEENN